MPRDARAVSPYRAQPVRHRMKPARAAVLPGSPSRCARILRLRISDFSHDDDTARQLAEAAALIQADPAFELIIPFYPTEIAPYFILARDKVLRLSCSRHLPRLLTRSR